MKLEVIVICFQICFGIRNTVRADDMGATCLLFAGPRVCIHEYDLSVHLVTVRKGLREGGVEVQPILGWSSRMRRMGHIDREVPLSTAKFRDKEPRAQQPERHDCWNQVGSYHDAYS